MLAMQAEALPLVEALDLVEDDLSAMYVIHPLRRVPQVYVAVHGGQRCRSCISWLFSFADFREEFHGRSTLAYLMVLMFTLLFLERTKP